MLYIVATPIGNLKDISERALETLCLVDVILCEDTRVTKKLLSVYGIQKETWSFHQYSSGGEMQRILGALKEGKSMALVTDAGTPAISDPGSFLVQLVVEQLGSTVPIIPIPGSSAAIAALSISGFPTDEFLFLGFPPHKKGRQTFFERVAATESTAVFYESCHRIEKCLDSLQKSIPTRPIVLCRELTKLYETIYRGTPVEVTAELQTGSMKGEFVIVVGPKK